MAKATLPKLSPPQLKALTNLAAGLHSSHGLRGQAQHGGHSSVCASLVRRGLIRYADGGHREITDAGIAAIKEHRK